MSENTKASKIDRIRQSQLDANKDIENLYGLVRLGHEHDRAVIKLQAAVIESLEADNAKMRKLLGKWLHERRMAQIPTLPLGGLCVCSACERLRAQSIR